MIARGLTAIALFCEVFYTDTAGFLILFVLRSPVFGFPQKFLKPFDSKFFLFFSKTRTFCRVYLASINNHVL
jgi:biotin transporter BioY